MNKRGMRFREDENKEEGLCLKNNDDEGKAIK
jgi:hypothetical protein